MSLQHKKSLDASGGIVVATSNSSWYYAGDPLLGFPIRLVEDYPEYWEEITKKPIKGLTIEGRQVYEGDVYYTTTFSGIILEVPAFEGMTLSTLYHPNGITGRFWEKEDAEKYLILNNKTLSISEIKDELLNVNLAPLLVNEILNRLNKKVKEDANKG